MLRFGVQPLSRAKQRPHCLSALSSATMDKRRVFYSITRIMAKNVTAAKVRITHDASTVLSASLGFSMPAEWKPHEATWLAWPHNATDWPGKLNSIQWVYGEMVRKIAAGEIVRL